MIFLCALCLLFVVLAAAALDKHREGVEVVKLLRGGVAPRMLNFDMIPDEDLDIFNQATTHAQAAALTDLHVLPPASAATVTATAPASGTTEQQSS